MAQVERIVVVVTFGWLGAWLRFGFRPSLFRRRRSLRRQLREAAIAWAVGSLLREYIHPRAPMRRR